MTVGAMGHAPALAAVCSGLAVALVVRRTADRRARLLRAPREQAQEPAIGFPLAAHRVAALLDLIAAAMDVGLGPTGALAAVAVGVPEPSRSRLRRAVAMVEMGGDEA